MALYTICPFIGPVLGPLISGYVGQATSLTLTYLYLPKRYHGQIYKPGAYAAFSTSVFLLNLRTVT